MNNKIDINLKSTITCPKCGYEKEEIIPENACQYFYECAHCKTVLRPKEGDCCVFCSYGNVPCTSGRERNDCCKK